MGSRTLDVVVSDNIYYADPSTFNDPLDARPSLEIDLDQAELERVLRCFVRRRVHAEMTAAAKTIKYRGPRTKDHISRHSRRQADQLIEEVRYLASNPDYDSEEQRRSLFGQYIELELVRQYEMGVVSLAESATCPLMWSHYGDQHRGVCLGYSVPNDASENLYQVQYGGSRLVEVSKVAAMLDGDIVARDQVDEAVLLRKAWGWRYEKEWRLIGSRGIRHSPLELEEIIFGIRCPESAKYAIMRALERRDRRIRFYEMREEIGTFKLKKYALTYNDELFVHFPRRSLTAIEMFKSSSAIESSD